MVLLGALYIILLAALPCHSDGAAVAVVYFILYYKLYFDRFLLSVSVDLIYYTVHYAYLAIESGAQSRLIILLESIRFVCGN